MCHLFQTKAIIIFKWSFIECLDALDLSNIRTWYNCMFTGYLWPAYKHIKRNAQIYSLTNRKVPDVHLDVQGGLSEDPGGDLWPAALTKRLWAEMEDKPQSRQLPSPKPMTLDILKPTLRIPDGNQTNRQLLSRIDRIAVSVFLFINSTKHYMQYRGQGFKLFW